MSILVNYRNLINGYALFCHDFAYCKDLIRCICVCINCTNLQICLVGLLGLEGSGGRGQGRPRCWRRLREQCRRRRSAEVLETGWERNWGWDRGGRFPETKTKEV